MAFCPYCEYECDIPYGEEFNCPTCGKMVTPEYSQLPPVVSHASSEVDDSALKIGPGASDILNQDIIQIADFITEDPDVFVEDENEDVKKRYESHKKWRKKNPEKVRAQAKRKRVRHSSTTGNSTRRWHTWNSIKQGKIKKPQSCPNKTKDCTSTIIGHHVDGASKKNQKKIKFMCTHCHEKLKKSGKHPKP